MAKTLDCKSSGQGSTAGHGRVKPAPVSSSCTLALSLSLCRTECVSAPSFVFSEVYR